MWLDKRTTKGIIRLPFVVTLSKGIAQRFPSCVRSSFERCWLHGSDVPFKQYLSNAIAQPLPEPAHGLRTRSNAPVPKYVRTPRRANMATQDTACYSPNAFQETSGRVPSGAGWKDADGNRGT
jgi:hypothetical protein